jgi:hypothetical protein
MIGKPQYVEMFSIQQPGKPMLVLTACSVCASAVLKEMQDVHSKWHSVNSIGLS